MKIEIPRWVLWVLFLVVALSAGFAVGLATAEVKRAPHECKCRCADRAPIWRPGTNLGAVR